MEESSTPGEAANDSDGGDEDERDFPAATLRAESPSSIGRRGSGMREKRSTLHCPKKGDTRTGAYGTGGDAHRASYARVTTPHWHTTSGRR